MISLSLCMIVKNEEAVIGRCLECVKTTADEIIIIDTGSTDATEAIVKKYTDKVYHFPWIDDFAAARNFSFSKATKDYVMWLDADDVVDEKNRNQLIELKETLDSSVDIVMMKYDVAFDENNQPTFSYYRERIFKRISNFHWVGEIHEVIVPTGQVIYCDIAISHKKEIVHDPKRNLRIFEKLRHSGKTLEPRQQYYYARELYYNGEYLKAIEIFDHFLNEGKGWIENNISACQNLHSCYQAIGESQTALLALFRSFSYDSPRAEICCDIGQHFMKLENYRVAIFWYQQAARTQPNHESGAFYMEDCYGFIPYLQLCVCYDKLGDYKTANECNEAVGKLKPESSSYKYNREYFRTLGFS